MDELEKGMESWEFSGGSCEVEEAEGAGEPAEYPVARGLVRVKKGGRPVITDWHEPFLAALRRTANITLAARLVETDPRMVRKHREKYARFREQYEDAMEEGIAVLEGEARRRALKGSDLLLIFLLKAHRPGVYDDKARLEITGKDGGAIPLAVVAKAVAVLDALEAEKALGPVVEVKALPEGKHGEGE